MLDDLFEEVFGYQGNDLSDDKKFNVLEKRAYELGDGELIHRLSDIKNSDRISLSLKTGVDFEDSMFFSRSFI